MNDATKQILISVAAASAAALVTGLVTHYFTKEATITSVANGTTPLPQGATPTTSVVTPSGSTPKASPPLPVANTPMTGGSPQQELGWIASSWKALGYQ